MKALCTLGWIAAISTTSGGYEAAAGQQRPRVLVLEANLSDGDVTWQQRFTTAVADGWKTLGTHEVLRADRAAKQKTDLEAEMLIRTEVGKVGSIFTLNVSLQRTERPEVIGGATEQAPSREELLALVPEVLSKAWENAAANRTPAQPSPIGAESRAPPTAARPAATVSSPLSLAVFPLSASGVEQRTTDNLTEILSTELKRLDNVSVLGLADVKALLGLEAQRQALGCDEDSSCLAELGDALGVDKVVTGEVGKVGEQFVIGLRLVDREAANVNNRVSERFAGPEEQLVRAIRAATRRLIDIKDERPGSIAISTNRSGASVFIDGELRARVPGPAVEKLSPGSHSVRVTAPGYFDWQGDIYVDPSETTAQWVELKEEPRLVRPFLPEWAYYGAWAGVAGLAMLTTLAAAVTGTAFVLYWSTRAGDEQGHVNGNLLETERNVAIGGMATSAGLLALTAVAGATVGAASFVVLWEAE